MSHTKMEDNIEKITIAVYSLQEGQKGLITHADSLQVTQDKIIDKLLVLESEISDVKSTILSEFSNSRNEYQHGQDQVIKILQKNDQEITFGTERIKRVEQRVDKVETVLDIA